MIETILALALVAVIVHNLWTYRQLERERRANTLFSLKINTLKSEYYDKLERKANEFALERERLYAKMEKVLTKQHGFSDETDTKTVHRPLETSIKRKMRLKTEAEHPSI